MAVITIREKQPTENGFAASLIFDGGEYPINITDPFTHQEGNVAQKLREYDQAGDYYQQALEINIEFGDRYSCASSYHNLGLLAQAEENYAEARANLQTALEIYVEYQDEYRAKVAREILESLPE